MPRLDGKNLWQSFRTGIALNRGPFLIAEADDALFDGDWTLIESADGRMSLYHIVNDPEETHDLLGEQTEVTRRLQATLAQIKSEFPAVQPRPDAGRSAAGPTADRPRPVP